MEMKTLFKKMIALNLSIILILSCFIVSLAYEKFQIVYDGNGGVTDDNKTSYSQDIESFDSVVTLPDDIFIKDRSVFFYWMGSDGNIYLPGNTYSLGHGISMSASWGKAKIRYYGNGGVTSENNDVIDQYVEQNYSSNYNDLERSLDGDVFNYDGYVFIGWNTKVDGSGEWYAPDIVVSEGTDIDVYAQWESAPYTGNYVRYSANGTDIWGGKEYKYELIDSFPTEIVLPSLSESSDKIKFWTNSSDDYGLYYGGKYSVRGNIYASNDSISVSENTTIYFRELSYSDEYSYAIYHGNGGANLQESTVKISYVSGNTIQLYNADAFFCKGKYLVSWNTQKNGSGITYKLDDKLLIEKNPVNLYAQYEDGNAVTYIGNGGKTDNDNSYFHQIVYSYDDITIVPNNYFSNGDKVLVGWQDDSGNWYYGNQTYDLSKGISLYAQWADYKVVYHKNSSSSDNETLVSQSEKIYDEQTFENNGFSFIGWNTIPDGTGEWYYIGQNIRKGTSIELYAQWIETPTKYVRYSANNSDALGGKSFNYVPLKSFPSDIILPELYFNNEGISYGWSDSDIRGNCYSPGEIIAIDTNTTIYAQTRYENLVVYYGNGGIGEDKHWGKTYTVTYSSIWNNKNVLVGDSTKFHHDDGYFSSWNTKPDGSGQIYMPGETVEVSDGQNLILYAQWKYIPENSMVYLGNGGITSDGSSEYFQQVLSFDSVTLSPFNTFSNKGFTFVGWQDFKNVWYDASKEYSMTDNKILTAQWGYARINYYDNIANDSHNSEKEVERIYSSPYEKDGWRVKNNNFTHEGYSFIDWNTKADGTGEWYQEGDFIEIQGEFDLYAQWIETPNRYICLVADGNDSLGGKSYEYIEIDAFPYDFVLPDMADTENALFAGWHTGEWIEQEMSSWTYNKRPMVSYSPMDTITVKENTVLYPWYTDYSKYGLYVLYYGNGATSATGSTVLLHNKASFSDLILYNGENCFTNNLGKFIEWNTKADGTGTAYNEGDTHSAKRLYAQWENGKNKYIKYIGNGGKTEDNKNEKYQFVSSYDSVELLDANTFSKEGYSFIGWKGQNGDIYFEGEKYSFDEYTVLTAQWGYARIQYHANTPDLSKNSQSNVQYMTWTDKIKSNMYSFEGHSFIGWNTSPDGTGEWYYELEEIASPIGIVNLYAQWESIIPYTESIVTKLGTKLIIDTKVHNITEPYDVLIAGYKNNKFVTMKRVPHDEQNSPYTLEGDMDKIKVMVWDGLSTLKPLYDAEEIPSSKWIAE